MIAIVRLKMLIRSTTEKFIRSLTDYWSVTISSTIRYFKYYLSISSNMYGISSTLSILSTI